MIFPCPFDPFAVLLGSILRFLLDTKREDEEVRTICSLGTTKKKHSHTTGICWIMFSYTRSPGLLKGKLCFFFGLLSLHLGMRYLWAVRILGERAKTPGQCDVIRASPLLGTICPSRIVFQNDPRTGGDDPEGNLNSSRTFIFGDFLFRNAAIPRAYTRQKAPGVLKTGNDCHFHSSNFTRGCGDERETMAMRAGANQIAYIPSHPSVNRFRFLQRAVAEHFCVVGLAGT